MNCEVEAPCLVDSTGTEIDEALEQDCASEPRSQDLLESWVRTLNSSLAFINPSSHKSPCDDEYENLTLLWEMMGIAYGTAMAGRGSGRVPHGITPSVKGRPQATGNHGKMSESQRQALKEDGFTEKELQILADPRPTQTVAEGHGLTPKALSKLRSRANDTLDIASLPQLLKDGKGKEALAQELWDFVRTVRGPLPEAERQALLQKRGVTMEQVDKWHAAFQAEGQGKGKRWKRSGGRPGKLTTDQRKRALTKFNAAIKKRDEALKKAPSDKAEKKVWDQKVWDEYNAGLSGIADEFQVSEGTIRDLRRGGRKNRPSGAERLKPPEPPRIDDYPWGSKEYETKLQDFLSRQAAYNREIQKQAGKITE